MLLSGGMAGLMPFKRQDDLLSRKSALSQGAHPEPFFPGSPSLSS